MMYPTCWHLASEVDILLLLFLWFPLTLIARMYFKENHRSHISCTEVQYTFILFIQNPNKIHFTVGVQKVSDFRALLISTVESRNIYVESLCKSFKLESKTRLRAGEMLSGLCTGSSAELDDLGSIPRTYMERENQLPKVFFWLPHMHSSTGAPPPRVNKYEQQHPEIRTLWF